MSWIFTILSEGVIKCVQQNLIDDRLILVRVMLVVM